MACGNNKITRAYLTTQPESLVEYMTQVVAARRAGVPNERNLGKYFLPNGQDQRLASDSVLKRYEDLKHGKYNHIHADQLDEDPSTWFVQGRDTVNKTDWGWFDRRGHSRHDHSGTIPLFEKGHYETVLLFHDPSPERIVKEMERMFSVANSRMRGGKR